MRVPVPADQLAAILGAEQTLTGVFLNVCGSAGAGDELLTRALTERGLASLSWSGSAASAEQAVQMAEAVARSFAATGNLEVAFDFAVNWYDQVLRRIGDTTAGDLRFGDDNQVGETAAWAPYTAQILETVTAATDLATVDPLDGDEVDRGDERRGLTDYVPTGTSTLPEYAHRAVLPSVLEVDYAAAYGRDWPDFAAPLTPFRSMVIAAGMTP